MPHVSDTTFFNAEAEVLHPAAETMADMGEASDQPIRTRVRQRQKPLDKAFHYLFLFYLFLYCSRIPELVPWHLSLLLQPPLVIGMLMTGRTKDILLSRPLKLLIALTCWIAICVVGSIWPMGSLSSFTTNIQCLLLAAFTVVFIRSVRDSLRAMNAVAFGLGTVAILSFLVGQGESGTDRLGLAKASTLGDPNTLALYLLVGLPLLYLTASYGSVIRRLVCVGMMGLALVGSVRTGSRMGLLVLAIGTVMVAVMGTVRQRVLVVASAVIFVIVGILFLPAALKERLSTVFQAAQNSSVSAEAAESSEARKERLIRSLEMTAEHPLFGTGPGVFMDADNMEAKAEGSKGRWHYQHNTYTQYSSELGVPGLVLFLAVIVTSYRGITAIRKRYNKGRIRDMSVYLQVAMVMAFCGAFFLSLAYGGLLYVLIAVAAAFQLAVLREEKASRKPQATPAETAAG